MQKVTGLLKVMILSRCKNDAEVDHGTFMGAKTFSKKIALMQHFLQTQIAFPVL